MGKRTLGQRKGRGSIFKAKRHKSRARVEIPEFDSETTGQVVELLHDTGRGAPLARIVSEEGEEFFVTAPEGVRLGQKVEVGGREDVEVGDIAPVGTLRPGTSVCNLENNPGDGGTLARSSGTFAQVVGSSPKGVEVRLPSGKTKVLDPECRAVVGPAAGAGRTEKPFLKAGSKYRWEKTKRGKNYPEVRGVAMNPVDHPFGGGGHQHTGKSKTVSKHSPPGKKVGSFGAKKSGSKKKG